MQRRLLTCISSLVCAKTTGDKCSSSSILLKLKVWATNSCVQEVSQLWKCSMRHLCRIHSLVWFISIDLSKWTKRWSATGCSRTVCVTLNLCQVSGSSGKQRISFPKSKEVEVRTAEINSIYLIRYCYLIYFLGGKEAEEARMGR